MFFLTKELDFRSCRSDSIPVSSKAIVEFVVNKDGSIQNIGILQSPHPCVNEPIRAAILRMPRWTPAEANGCPVRMRFRLPVRVRWE
jgi:protein TonB